MASPEWLQYPAVVQLPAAVSPLLGGVPALRVVALPSPGTAPAPAPVRPAPVLPSLPWAPGLGPRPVQIDLSRAREAEQVYHDPGYVAGVVVENLSELVGVRVVAQFDDPQAPGVDLLRYRQLPTRPFQRLYLTHDAYPGRRLRLLLLDFSTVAAVPADQGTVQVVVQAPSGQAVAAATEDTLAQVAQAVSRLAPIPNAGRRYELDLTADHVDQSLAQALGLAVPIGGLHVTILRLGSAPWSMRFLPQAAYPDTWYSTDFNEGASFEGLFDDILFSNAATAGATPAIFAVARRI